MEEDRKQNRRNSFKNKKYKTTNKDYIVDRKDQTKLKKAFKHKKIELEEEEVWEQWEDEIY